MKRMIIAAVVTAMCLCGCGSKAQNMKVSTGEDGVITAVAENAADKSGGSGNISITAEGQVLKVDSELSGEGQIEIIVKDPNSGETKEQKTVSGNNDTELSLPVGEYMVALTATEGATGTVTLKVDTNQ